MRHLFIVLGLSLATAAQAQHYPSPTDWRNENIYQIITDRFYDGNPSNDNVEASRGSPYNPTYNAGIHGGDFQGIQDKLDYIKALGATAIWISPIPLNIGDGSSAYHGYAAQDFYTLAPHWGTMTDLSNMVQAAHARGIKVILDIVCNHMGNLITSTDPGWPNWVAPPAGYNIQYSNINNQHAFPFNPTNVIPPLLSTIFHTNGDIQGSATEQEILLGQLDGLNDLATETTYVRTNLMNVYTNWVGLADFDAFRVDTAIYVDYGFWQYWCPQLHQYGTSIGKSNFFMFGEAFSTDEQQVGSYTGTEDGGPFMFNAMLDYPLYLNCINSVFANADGNTAQIENHYDNLDTYYDSNSWYRMITFLDNHDNARFLSSGNANGNTNNLTVALQFLYTSRGIPSLYYGTEQAFAGDDNNNDNREDMFAGAWQPQIPVLGDNFNETQPLFQQVAKLNNFRRLYPALCTGVHNNLWNDSNGPGLFAYSRVLSNQEVFVCFNTAASSQTLTNRPTTYSPGTILVNLLNTNDTIVVTTAFGTNATPQITVPGMTAKIYIAQSQVLPLDPVVVRQTPTHAETCVAGSAPIVLQFSKPMNTNSVQAAFSVTPATTGTFTWDTVHETMTFTPSAAWPVFTTNMVRLLTNAVDSVSAYSLYAPFDTFFVTYTTNTVTTGSSPPAGGTTSGGGLVNCGSNVTVCATPNACYNFLYWSQNGSILSTSACHSFSVTGNEAVVANFVNGQGSLATDNAADPVYASGSWTNSLNGGSGFGPWILLETTTNGACNGFFVSASIASSPHAPPGIDVNGQSWGMYANTENCGEPTIAAAYRAFAIGSLQPGGQILLDMDTGLNDMAGSAVGFALRNGDATNYPTDYTTGARLQFYLAGGSADYTVVDAAGAYDSRVPLTYSGMHLIFALGTNDSYTLTIITYGSNSTNTVSGTLGGTPSSALGSIALFNNDNGADPPHDVFFNSLSVANFTPITYNINTSSSPASGGSTSGGGTVPCGSNVTVCASVNAACYTFANWTRNGNVVSTSACYAFIPVTNEALVANFSPNQDTITTSSSPVGGGSTSGGSTVGCGCNVTVCAAVNACYSFANWTLYGNVVSTSACYTFTATSNETLAANFVPTSCTITTTNVLIGAGSTSGGGTVPCGSAVTVCATPSPCYNFTGWAPLYGSVVSTSACYTFTATNSEILAANFEFGFTYRTITTSSSPSGGGSTSGGGPVTCGSLATVCARANSCYSFANWTLNGNLVSTSACYTLTAVSNETLIANFAVNGDLTGGSLTSLWSFTGTSDGANPSAGLVQGSDGSFYGTTYGLGSGPSANGTVFRISASGSLTGLWSFTGGTDGANPDAGLVQGSDGNFYGTTSGSGSGRSPYGTVFRISASGSLTGLWSFTGGTDGANPDAGLVQGSDGNFYGTTYGAGSGPSGNGTVFRISPTGNLSNLWSFTGGTDGANPSAGLVQGSDGNFYGTTYGSGSGPSAYGTVFRISAGGSLTKLWSFTNGLDGANSYAPLVEGSDGNFYGTTSQGGASGIGTVFRISPTGNLTNLWEFTGCGDGGNPDAGLVQGSDGDFYGTTSGSGSGPSGSGTVFRISPSGDLTTLHSFSVGDGANPYAGLVQGSDGNFYGTTYQGGTNGNYGTVFRLTVPLNPPANQISGIKMMGTSLVVTIPSVAGETYQLQYSDSLTLSNWSNVGGVSMTNSIGGLLSLTNLGGAMQPQGFYRFAITP